MGNKNLVASSFTRHISLTFHLWGISSDMWKQKMDENMNHNFCKTRKICMQKSRKKHRRFHALTLRQVSLFLNCWMQFFRPPNAVYWLKGSLQRLSLLPLLSFAASLPFLARKEQYFIRVLNFELPTCKSNILSKIASSMDKLVTRQSRLADPNHGTAIKSFRKSEDQKSKLPYKFWDKS